ncbi:hypothetical protein MMC13_005095 [Lambiella insularis]|nr:hypothetical protein [Lambiella insularis]
MNDVRSSEIGAVGTLFITCLELFRSCYSFLDSSCQHVPNRDAFKEELESYLLWGNHYHPGTGRLDRAVVALSEELRDGLTAYIGNIGQILCQRLLTLVEWPKEQWLAKEKSNNRVEEVSKLLDGLRDIGIELDDSVLDEDSFEFVVEDLKINIDLLHELVPTLDDIPLDPEAPDIATPNNAASPKQSYLSGPVGHYCRKILDRFPLLDTRLVERFGLASWKRHKRVRESLDAIAEVASFDDPQFDDYGLIPQLDGQAADRSTNFHDSGLGTTIRTASKYAASQASFQSFMSSRADIEGGHARLPPLPSETLFGKPFNCSICGGIIRDVKSKLQWRHHVYSDLSAYNCIVADCATEDAFTSRGMLAAHLAEEHRSLRDPERQRCPFCNKTPSLAKFIGHVSHHLEELSLCAIPQDASSESESDGIGSSVAASESLSNDLGHWNFRKVWVCVDVSKDEKKLSGCRPCNSGKEYLAHYNAVAHLRRVHFDSRPKGRKHQKDNGECVGEWPTLDFLKKWIEERSIYEKDISQLTREPLFPESLSISPTDQSHDYYESNDESSKLGTLPLHSTSSGIPPLSAVSAVPQPASSPASTSSQRSLKLEEEFYSSAGEGRERGRCPYRDCNRLFKDLKYHMITHHLERTEKCPIVTCEYHQKGFARKYDKNRHTLTHYKGTMVCGFCPGPGSAAEKSFNRADVFRHHLISVHGVEQDASNSRKKRLSLSPTRKTTSASQATAGKCSFCFLTFNNAQIFFEHLDQCIINQVSRSQPSEASENDVKLLGAYDRVGKLATSIHGISGA